MATATDVDVTRGFVKTPHGHIEYREAGEGEPFVILHTTPSTSEQYQPLFGYFSGRYRVVAPTTIGYGQSDRPPEPYTSVREFAQALSWFLDGLGLGSVHLFGAKTGAQVAIDLAGWQPGRVRSLVLDEPFDYCNEEGRALHGRIHRYYPERPDGGHLVEIWKRVGGGRPGADLADVNRSLMNLLAINAGGDDVRSIYGDMGWEGAGPHAICHFPTFEHTPLIQAPSLVIHGSESRLRSLHDRFVETIPDARGVLMGNAGLGESATRPAHLRGQFFAAQAPEEWSGAILRFLDETQRATA
ncbi:MAG: alpha/beta fold hydrolase [Chloroflexi bacterium]|nr:alpha/beta fold hydrolase [Chloroflexota bacterium]